MSKHGFGLPRCSPFGPPHVDEVGPGASFAIRVANKNEQESSIHQRENSISSQIWVLSRKSHGGGTRDTFWAICITKTVNFRDCRIRSAAFERFGWILGEQAVECPRRALEKALELLKEEFGLEMQVRSIAFAPSSKHSDRLRIRIYSSRSSPEEWTRNSNSENKF